MVDPHRGGVIVPQLTGVYVPVRTCCTLSIQARVLSLADTDAGGFLMSRASLFAVLAVVFAVTTLPGQESPDELRWYKGNTHTHAEQ